MHTTWHACHVHLWCVSLKNFGHCTEWQGLHNEQHEQHPRHMQCHADFLQLLLLPQNSQTCISSWARISWSACHWDLTSSSRWMSSSCMRAFSTTWRISLGHVSTCKHMHCDMIHMPSICLHLKHRAKCRARPNCSCTTVSDEPSLVWTTFEQSTHDLPWHAL